MADPGNIEPLLIQTKLYRPPVGAGLVERPHLLARLEEGLSRELILVSAPPGSGKTTLASQWLEECGWRSTWLSLDERDNHLPQFLRYVCAAVRCCFPEACTALQGLLASGFSSSATNLPDTDHLADLLVEELNALPDELILVLDDYHRIRAREVHHVLRQLLRYRPPRLHLALLTRFDPPLALGRLRLEQRMVEIRAADLRFGLAETRLLLQAQIDRPLDDELVGSLQARTEGWAIGLQLAAISLAGQPQSQSPDQLLARFGGSHRLLAGYLVEEVMAHLPEEVTAFLTRTALVDRFCAPLGDALLAGTPWAGSGQAAIAYLEAQNLFIISLDDEGDWYRYHDLFRDFLRMQFIRLHRLKVEQDPAGLADLHQRAGAWLAQAGMIEDALRHLIAAGDEAQAAELVEAELHPLLNERIPAPVLARWLDLFPERSIQAHPGLLIAQVYLLIFRWDMAALAEALDRAETLVQATPPLNPPRATDRFGRHGGEEEAARPRAGATPSPSPVQPTLRRLGEGRGGGLSSAQARLRQAVLDGLRGYMTYWQGDAGRAISLVQRGLQNLDPVACSFTHAQFLQILAQAYAACGQRERALDLLSRALDQSTVPGRPELLIFLGVRALIHINAGELAECAGAAEQLLERADAPQARPDWSGSGLVRIWRGWAHYFLGAARYEQNDLAAAASHWRRVEEMRYQVNPGAFCDSLIGLALVARAQGAPIQALACAQAAREYAGEVRSPPFMRLAEALLVRLALSGGQGAEAVRGAHEIDTAANPGNALWLEPPCLAALRVLLAETTPASLTAARQGAETYLRQAESAHNTRKVIQAAAFNALVWRAQRRTPEALAALERALALAEPGGFLRTFLDLGAPMAELLQQFQRQRRSTPYVRRLLAAFAREVDPVGRRELAAQYGQLYDITPLTPRELELLDLVAQRLSYREIAERLVISPNTVKKHVGNVYGKLGVSSRRQAIARAQEVGLLGQM